MHQRIRPLVIALLLLLAPVASQAVQFGWQPLPDGGIEYLVQVEPDLLDSFRQEGFTSDIPASLQRELRRIHITVGNSKLPNQGDVIGPKTISTDAMPSPTAPLGTISASTAPAAPTQPNGVPTPATPTPATLMPSSAPPPEAAASTFNELNLPPPPAMNESSPQPKVDSSAADTPRPLSSLPFFPPGQITQIVGSNPPDNSQTTKPRLTANEEPTGQPHSFAANTSDHLAIGAAKPTVADVVFPQEKTAANSAGVGATSKPWLPLMAALLGLFASLGANVYLAWIHQGVRAKYRILVQRMQGSAVAAI